MTYTVHPAAAVFPMLNDAELTALAEDIKQHGLRQPIVLNHNETILVDGRNRLRACEIAGADFTVVTLPEDYTDGMIIEYIVSANLRRRNLTPGQRAMVAAELEPIYAEAAAQRVGGRPKLGEEKPPANSPEVLPRDNEAREQAAKVVGSSGRSVSDAKALKKEAPDLADKVSNGQMTLNAATKERKARSAPAPKPDAPQPKPPQVKAEDEAEDEDWEGPNIFAEPELLPTVADMTALGKALEAVRVALGKVLANSYADDVNVVLDGDDEPVPQWCVNFLESQAMAQNIQPMADVAATMTRITEVYGVDGVDWWSAP